MSYPYEGFNRGLPPSLDGQREDTSGPLIKANRKPGDLLSADTSKQLHELGPTDGVLSRTAVEAGRRAIILDAGQALTSTGENPADLPSGTIDSLGGQHVHIIGDSEVTTVPVHILGSER